MKLFRNLSAVFVSGPGSACVPAAVRAAAHVCSRACAPAGARSRSRARIPLAALMAAALLIPLALSAATPAVAQADQLPNPDWVALLSDYEKDYWQAPKSKQQGGKVLDATTMKLDEDITLDINHRAAEGADQNGLTDQRKRALIDSDLYGEETMPDALGPVLGKYMSEGFKQGRLNRISDLFKFNVASTYQSKRAAMHPRPYLDRSVSTFDGTNDLAGLPATLDIKLSPSWLEHIPGYSNLQKNSSYPSGHTTAAYSWGIALAGILPELAPQILARASEAGNNRIVLGVHYPLDIMGGRIGASAQNGQYWHNEYSSAIVPAARQLRDYLTERCKADGHGSTLVECIADLKANGSGGYSNDFLDPVATEPVKDQASAVRVYTARMTYTFPQVKSEAGTEFKAPRGAADVLRLAYPQLHADQREAILKATALDSGYPLWKSSDGWQRINWAKALFARVTLDENGDVAKVETADKVALDGPTVVNAQYADKGGHPASDAAAGENSATAAGPDLTTMHTAQRSAVIAVGVALAVAVIAGVAVTVVRRRRA